MAKKPPAPAHRGSIQVQGTDMAPMLSHSWARNGPISASDGVAELDRLQGRCTPTQLRIRKQAFPKARRFIAHLAGKGLPGPTTYKFHDRGVSPKQARIDIDLKKGWAFI